MRLLVDLETGAWSTWRSSPTASISLRRRDRLVVAVRFASGGQVVEWPSNAAGIFGLKQGFGEQFAALADAWTPSGYGADRHYSFDLSLNTQELESLFAEEPASVSLLAEVSVTSGTQIFSSQTLRVIVTNDVIRGDEGAPSETIEYKATQAEALEGTSDEKWMTPLRTRAAVGAFPPSPHGHVIEDVADLADELAGKAASEHTHVISDVTDLADELAGKADSEHTHVIAGVTGLADELAGKAASEHTHVISDVTDLADELAGKADSEHTHVIADVADLADELAGKADSEHTHVIADVTGLADELDSKAASEHTHVISDVTDLADELAGKADSEHTHVIADVTGLADELDSKAASEHTHVIADVTDLADELAGKAASEHTHVIADVTGLADELAGKADSEHTHVIADVTGLADELDSKAATALVGSPVEYIIACSNETTALFAGTAKVTFRAPVAFQLTSVSSSVTVAPTGSSLMVDINNEADSALSTKLSIDATEKSSATAATPAVIDAAFRDFAQDAEITIDIDQIGSVAAGAGLKVVLRGLRL
jgi:phenylpyruvate tautomerase PptA (4-oxalocrotonate tautomerase family)